MEFLTLDLGGITDDGLQIDGTFECLPLDDLGPVAAARAEFTIKLLGLNREVIRVARENAFSGFLDRLNGYVGERQRGAGDRTLDRRRKDLLRTPHLTVFAEMRRQRAWLPEIDDLLERAPEAAAWPLFE
jgi:hypothetical protein